MSRHYRRWAFESAALDLALRQAGRSLAEVVGREPRPLTYVVSMRLKGFDEEGPETADKVNRLLARYPSLQFKLDPTNSWTQELVAELAATGAVDSLDLKGHYRGTPVDVDTDPELYRMVAEGFPDAWIEDPDLSVPEADEVLEPHRDRITWDAPIHSIADIEALPFKPKTMNIKPSRVGPLEALCAVYDTASARASAPTAAARASWASAATTSSTWRRPSTRTRRTTPGRVSTTSPIRRTACPRARGPCRSPTPASASRRRTWSGSSASSSCAETSSTWRWRW